MPVLSRRQCGKPDQASDANQKALDPLLCFIASAAAESRDLTLSELGVRDGCGFGYERLAGCRKDGPHPAGQPRHFEQ